MKLAKLAFLLLLISCVISDKAYAQLSGSNVPGDFGIKSGSQAPPGLYLTYFLYHYSPSTIRGGPGQEFSFQEGGGLDMWAHVAGISYTDVRKLLGGNIGATIFLPLTNINIEAPRIDLSDSTSYGLGDMWFQPFSLGWHKPRADFVTWYALYMPTGRYEPDSGGNRGLGMWSQEVTLGTTVYFNESQSLHASMLNSFEFHSHKKDSDTQVGNLVTIEGGAGATVKKAITFGMAYYLQWKLSDDSGLDLPPLVEGRLGKNRNFGLGPEASLILPLSKDLSKLLIVDFRYEFETGGRFDTEGDILAFSATFKAW